MKKFVSIAGNIGSGKSSLTKLLSEEFGWIPYYESVTDNPYLEDFYSDMKRWSFNLQIYFLSHRFRIHKEIIERKESVIQDRSIYEDVEIFAENLYKLGRMSDRDYENYKNLFAEMVSYLKPPDLLVYLRAGTETLKNQIKLRGRDFEKNIETSYLESLNSCYEQWMSEYKHGSYITIDTDNLDFVNKTEDLDFIKEKIQNSLK
ncbi:MAG TPA: deoxynucleoside kinase [Ignavibacteria bacterium]|nr:deoxynucleoside kinase [Ignavibacteria bacterium]